MRYTYSRSEEGATGEDGERLERPREPLELEELEAFPGRSVRQMSELKHISVDFNTLNSAPVGLLKIADPLRIPEYHYLHLQDGERVLLVDSDLQAEGTIILRDGWILAKPDPDTYEDLPVDEQYLRGSTPPEPDEV